ncbi:MAG: hypothetical protein BWX88_00520 [Planctomycetes bacterium ADurb.Bin126]|nr:MAG: hypothetical protein BWX88_00520 [Planctomycetes bacterium ADurb.Bin126]
MTPEDMKRRTKKFALAIIQFVAAAVSPALADLPAAMDISPVWSGHPVGFCLLTHKDRQFVAFYDADRVMSVAQRRLDQDKFTLTRLDQKVVWDSHNYITMTVDDDGLLHLAGNMHCVPLIYYRSEKPLDASTLKRVPQMVGPNEKRCTYPRFLRGAGNELLFTYRDGSSGNGNQICNVWDQATRTWKRLIQTPLTDGQGKMNAYFHGPIRGPDGLFHLCWVWRDHGGCESNHDLSYARSKDLIHWQTSQGKPLTLPLTLTGSEIVDPVPAKGGIINGNAAIGFDSRGQVLISYHKYDAAGKTQLYVARPDKDGWLIRQVTNWAWRWDFSGGGSIHFAVRVGPVQPAGKGLLALGFGHDQYGSGNVFLDEATLQPAPQARPARDKTTVRPAYPPGSGKPEQDFPGLQVRWRADSGSAVDGLRYVLRWETLGPNRDRPVKAPLPKPSMLRLYRLPHAPLSQAGS